MNGDACSRSEATRGETHSLTLFLPRQNEAMKWAKYMQATTEAGIVEQMEQTDLRDDDDDFDEDRGDYVAFDGVPPATAAAAPERPGSPADDGGHLTGDARQESLDALKNERNWNN